MVQGDKATEGARGGTHGHVTIGLGCSPSHACHGHTERSPRCPGRRKALCDPAGRGSPGEKFCSLVPITNTASPVLSQHNLWHRRHQGTCKHPRPPDSRRQPPWARHGLHPCKPPAKYLLSGCSRHIDLQHPSPPRAAGTVPRVQLGTACAEPALRASPRKARPAPQPLPALSAQPRPG